jgi:hypothetical protein
VPEARVQVLPSSAAFDARKRGNREALRLKEQEAREKEAQEEKETSEKEAREKGAREREAREKKA